MPNPHIQKYLTEVQSKLSSGISQEHGYRIPLENLLTALFPRIKPINDAKKIDVGAPDFHLLSGETPVGYIEAKDIGKDLDDKETQKQNTRYVEGLANVVLTDYLEFRWYLINPKKPVYTVVLAEKKGEKIIPIEGRDEALIALLTKFVTTEDARTVKSAKELAKRMANLAKIIRDIISKALKITDESTQLHETMKSFKDVLLHDLDDEKFADMYAQTICYGMFAARVNHTITEKNPFVRMTAGFDLPKTNPFLRQLFNTIAGPELDERVIWAVDDLANLLHHADMEGILKDFGKRTRQEDPVVHFYETFLSAYDPKLREKRGVYYTPEPVVSYIVRSVNHILKTDFGLEKGLADSSKIKSPVMPEEEIHKLLILDPACGTGTFLHGVIDQIHENFKGNEGTWSSYVSEHLFPRIFGFELLMAPYAVAHLKLGLQLKEYHYDFKSDERLRVYLTNTLEEAFHADEKLPLTNWLAKEANAANEVKRDLPIMVVLGNPPYQGNSANSSWRNELNPKTGKNKRKKTWIGKLLMGDDNKKNTEYYLVDGKPLGEKNPKYLQDDYVKFIRFAQWRIEQTGYGIIAFISNHGYIDNPTFPGMRQSLLKTFDDIYILDLHGNVKKKERSPDGSKDENVFDIKQGAAIGIFIKRKIGQKSNTIVRHSDLYGTRSKKYNALLQMGVDNTEWQEVKPSKPHYLFISQKGNLQDEFSSFRVITDIMKTSSNGFKTHRDNLAVAFEKKQIEKNIDLILDDSIDEQSKYISLGEKPTSDWSIVKAKKRIRLLANWRTSVKKCLYRPFDFRYCFHNNGMMDRPRTDELFHLDFPNYAIAIGRQGQAVGGGEWSLIYSGKYIADTNLFYRGGIQYYPLYIYTNNSENDPLFSEGVSVNDANPAIRSPNLSAEFITEMVKRLGMKFISDGKGNLKKTFGPEDIFHYMYAVFHSPIYRTRYAEFLKIDFPRLPMTSDVKLFTSLVKLGEELVKLHLMEKYGKKLVKFPKKGSDVVEVCRFESDSGHNKVEINADQYFEGVPEDVWNFHIGGYQVAHKWLKDRKGRKLSFDDIEHYGKIISALSETMRLMKEIDEVILGAGGFPFK